VYYGEECPVRGGCRGQREFRIGRDGGSLPFQSDRDRESPQGTTGPGAILFYLSGSWTEVFIKDRQPGENNKELNGLGLGMRLNIPPLGTNYPAVSFALAYGFPVFW
jgi:hypothetical protein